MNIETVSIVSWSGIFYAGSTLMVNVLNLPRLRIIVRMRIFNIKGSLANSAFKTGNTFKIQAEINGEK